MKGTSIHIICKSLKKAFQSAQLALLVLLITIGAQSTSLAQQFPVRVNTFITPPYSIYLSDYTAPESNSLTVMLSLRDLDRPQYQTKLRIKLEGSNGITIQTIPGYTPPPIVLSGGITETLTGYDLRNYLNPDNLEFEGITRADFIRSGTLPEGFYTLTVEALDYNRNVVVSNSGMANAWFVLNDPPLINLPFDGEKVRVTDPQNVMFSWTPRHTASPNAAFNTEYEFKLVEIYPEGRNPNDAILASNSIYETTTTTTSLNYSITEPLLIPGRTYAFRIRAYDIDGRDLFKNQGYSEVYTFKFGEACKAPENVTGEAPDPDRMKVSWDTQTNHTEYVLRHRKQGSSEWFTEETFLDAVMVPGLETSSTYEYQVQARCEFQESEFSPIETVTTPEIDEDEFVCGSDFVPVDISTSPLLVPLLPAMTIKTADFRVIIKEATQNQDGTYAGTGWAMIPWFELATVRVKFNNIRVNSQLEVFDGQIVTVYSNNSRFVLEDDTPLSEAGTTGDSDSEDFTDPVDDFFDGYDFIDTVEVDYDITDVTTNDDGDIVITYEDANGDLQEEIIDIDDETGDILVTDESGNSWAVDENGDVSESPANEPDPISDPAQVDYIVQFTPSDNQSYGFDYKTFNGGEYDELTIQDEDYTVAYKSVESARTDIVTAVTSRAEFPTEVGFKSQDGLVTSSPGENNNEKQISINGKYAGYEETIDAYVNIEADGEDEELLVGKLNVVTYDKVSPRVVIVPVNSDATYDAEAIARELNGIYKQAIVEWHVRVEAKYEVNQNTISGLTDGQSGMVSSYTPNMRAFNQAFRDNGPQMDDNAFYLFLVSGADAGLGGFMPFKRQFGYIFTDELDNYTLEKAIAHELGHGAFRLRHTFSPEDFKANQNSTDNLMDYAGGTQLKKYQWDLIHSPENMNGWFEEDEESMYDPWEMLNQGYTVATIPDVPESQNTVSFVAPTGLLYTLPKTVQDISFSEQGYLTAFTLDGERYVGFSGGSDFKFKGFKADNIETGTPGEYRPDPNSPMPNGYEEELSMNLNYSEPINVYYVLYTAGDCGTAVLYKEQYKGARISAKNNGAMDEYDFHLYKSKNIGLTSSGSIEPTEGNQGLALNDIFNCIDKKEIKYLYKYIEYKHGHESDLNIAFLNGLASNLMKLGSIELTGFENDDEKENIEKWTLKLDSYGDILLFKNAIETFIADASKNPSKTKLQITLLDDNGNSRFITGISDLIPLGNAFESIMGCIDNENTLSLNGYYIPHCYWKDAEVGMNSYYTYNDVAYTSGLIDGAIATVHGLYQLVVALEKQKLAWTYGNYECAESAQDFLKEYTELTNILTKIGVNMTGIQVTTNTQAIAEILDLDSKKALEIEITAIKAIKEGLTITDSDVEKVVTILRKLQQEMPEDFEKRADELIRFSKFLNPVDVASSTALECTDYEEARKQLKDVLSLIEQLTDPENGDLRSEVFNSFMDGFEQYFGATLATDNVARYNHGKVIFEIALEVAGLVYSGGAVNVATKIKKIGSLSVDAVKQITKLLRKRLKGINGVKWKNGKVLSEASEEVLIQLAEETGTFQIKKLAPDADNLSRKDADAFFEDVEYELPDGTKGKGDIEIVTDGDQDYVRVMQKAFSNLSDDGTRLTLTPTDLTKIADEAGSPIADLNKVTQVEIRGKTYNLPKDSYITDAGDGKYHIPGFCFVAGTQIQLSNNKLESIENIKEDDIVWSYNHSTNKAEKSKVQSLFKKTVKKLAKVVVAGSMFLSTVDHPYYANGQYIEAADLKIGDKIQMLDGGYGAVESVTLKDTTVTVYNFQVAENHNYFIGESGYLVHNDCNMNRIDDVFTKSSIADKSKVTKYYDEVTKLNDIDKQVAINKKVAELSDQKLAEFINDFADKDGLSSFLTDPKMVDTWDMLFTSPVIRKEIVNLENLEDVMSLYRQGAFSSGQWFEATSKINSSKSKRKLIENLAGKSSADEVLEVIRQSAANNRAAMADKLTDLYGENAYKRVKIEIRNSGPVHDNLSTAFEKICNQNLTQQMEELIDLYRGNKEIQEKIIKGFDERYTKAQWKEVFKEYQAHHIIPINTLADESPIIRDIIEYALENGSFKVNDIDNLLFLDRNNHFGSHGAYDNLILNEVTKRVRALEDADLYNHEEGFQILQDVIKSVKKKMRDEFIGKDRKINTLDSL